jgi:hypothetical protein
MKDQEKSIEEFIKELRAVRSLLKDIGLPGQGGGMEEGDRGDLK